MRALRRPGMMAAMTSHERAAPQRAGRLNAPPAQVAGERETLSAYLDFHRATLAMKCFGLTDEQLRQRPVVPSGLSLLGLVRHLADVERNARHNGHATCCAGASTAPSASSGEVAR